MSCNYTLIKLTRKVANYFNRFLLNCKKLSTKNFLFLDWNFNSYHKRGKNGLKEQDANL